MARHKETIVDDVPEGGKGATNAEATAPSPSSAKRSEPIRSRSSVPVVMHEEGAPIRHKGGILVPPAFVVLMLLSPPLYLGTWLLTHRRGRANNNGGRG